ncbi:MAG: GNAT family N-acetyltransferase [Rickettsiales bacterium]|jgi:ribosomal-protein-serine acetyltransferase|nr:GNAT family N-acetyltransferase [Rickettsiales bacterium]
MTDLKYVKARKRLVGERVVLRTLPTTFASAELLFAFVQANREHLLPWLDWVLEVKCAEDEFRALLRWEKERKEWGMLNYGIFAGGKMVGAIDFQKFSGRDRSCEIGYMLDAGAEGNGFMGEALALVEAELFKAGISRISIRCDERNKKSAAVAKRAGYKLEGHFIKDRYSKPDGRFVDTLYFTKLNLKR